MDVTPPIPRVGGGGSMDPASVEISNNSSSRRPRVYQVWRGSNIFFLQGRLIFGPDANSLFLTIFLIVVPVSIFCVFVARKLIDDFPYHAGISIIVITVVFTFYDLALLLLISGRDPGIIPRNKHPPEPESYDGSSDGPQTPPLRIPRVKDVRVNGIIVRVKYCDTCMLYRPPRCSHCSICNNCVQHFDHHCPWVGQCIGLRNYRFFFMFVFSTTLLCIYVLAFSCVYIIRIMHSEDITIWKAMAKTPASVALIIYTFLSVWFVGGLTIFHLYLISNNQTTYENFRYRYEGRLNPHDIGIMGNFKGVFFSSIPPSKNNFRAVVSEEPSLRARAVGGDFCSPNMGRAVKDLELGRKATWSEAATEDDMEARHNNDEVDRDAGVGEGDLSLDLHYNPPSEIPEAFADIQTRQSENLEIST